MAQTLQDRAWAIRKLNNIIYFRLNQAHSNILTSKYNHDSSYNWEYLAKNFNTISDDPIAKNNFLKLNHHILLIGYLEDGSSCFTEVIEYEDEDKEEQDNKL